MSARDERGPVFWIIETERGWLVRRFWYGEYDTLSIHQPREAAEREILNLASGGIYELNTRKECK